MEDQTAGLMRLRGQLTAALELVDRLAQGVPTADDERRILAQAALNVANHQPRTRRDVMRFTQALEGGDEGWLIIQSVPGEHRTEAVYLPKLPAAAKRALGI